MTIPVARIVRSGNGNSVFLDGHNLPGVTGIKAEWIPSLKTPMATITITATLEEYTGEPRDPLAWNVTPTE